MHSIAEKVHLLEPTTIIGMKIDPYYRWQKCRLMCLVSGDEMRRAIYRGDIAICSFSMIPKCMTLNDPNGYFTLNSAFAPFWLAPTVRLSKNNCVKNNNKDRCILLAARIFCRESSFWQYKDCADIHSGYLKRRR